MENWIVDLTALSSPALVPVAIAETVGIAAAAGECTLERLKSWLHCRPVVAQATQSSRVLG